MKVKFNKYERTAGVFVLAAMVGALSFVVAAAVQQNWFASKVKYFTTFERGQGLYPGTRVEIMGLKVGSVESVEFQTDNKIVVWFSVYEKYANRIKNDSVVRAARPFIIGDKVLDISVGGETSPEKSHEDYIASEDSFDIMDMMDGRRLSPYMKSISGITENLRLIAEAFSDTKRTKSFINMFDRVEPLLINGNKAAMALVEMSGQMTQDKNLQITIKNLALTTMQLNDMIKEMPTMGKDMAEMMKTMSSLAVILNEMIPTMKEMTPEIPKATRRAIEALDEAVVVLKAMQKSFMFSSAAKEAKEEIKAEDAKKRKPASSEMPENERNER